MNLPIQEMYASTERYLVSHQYCTVHDDWDGDCRCPKRSARDIERD